MSSSIIVEDVKPVFARHETFHPRFGWLKKGFDRASEDGNIFTAEDAPVQLGVGKNMVASIRYWCRAFKLLEDDRPTDFGKRLLSDGGWDPFLEDPASLWLLHWRLLQPPCEAAAWYFAFNQFPAAEFYREDLLEALRKYREIFGRKISDNSLKKDITCLLRMYGESEEKKGAIEDSINCPFAELGILQKVEGTKRYYFKVGNKPTLPADIICYSCLDFARSLGNQKTVSVSSLTYDAGSPGQVFKLTETAIFEAIEAAAKRHSSLLIDDTAGLIQFSFTKDPKELSEDLIEGYYSGKQNR